MKHHLWPNVIGKIEIISAATLVSHLHSVLQL